MRGQLRAGGLPTVLPAFYRHDRVLLLPGSVHVQPLASAAGHHLGMWTVMISRDSVSRYGQRRRAALLAGLALAMTATRGDANGRTLSLAIIRVAEGLPHEAPVARLVRGIARD